MDQDLWLKALHFHGPLLLHTILGEVPDSKSKTESEKLNMCKFIKNKSHLLFKTCKYSSDALPEHSIPIVPVELFQNSAPMDRRDLFFKSLDRGNIILLKVINDNLPDNYKLLVLCRQDNCMKLDDLSIIMYLPKLPAELKLAGGKLESNDLIRAAVCSCSIDERKLYVTLDSNVLEDETENVKLGKISESDLPFYNGDVFVGASYVEYLRHKPEFNNPTWSDELYAFLDIKKDYLYSFFEDVDGLKYSTDLCGSELKKKHLLAFSNAEFNKGVEFYEIGNFSDAFVHYNNALSIYPKSIEALVARGVLYANTNDLRKAFGDMEDALKIDPNHEGACKQMSVLLVAAARLHIENNDFDKAKESLDFALNLDSNNKDAVAAVEEIKENFIVGISYLMHLIKSASGVFDNAKLNKKTRIGSNSSESSSSKKDDTTNVQKQFLQESTRAFLSSMKKKHYYGKKNHHPKEKKSPKKPRNRIVNNTNLIQLTNN